MATAWKYSPPLCSRNRPRPPLVSAATTNEPLKRVKPEASVKDAPSVVSTFERWSRTFKTYSWLSPCEPPHP